MGISGGVGSAISIARAQSAQVTVSSHVLNGRGSRRSGLRLVSEQARCRRGLSGSRCWSRGSGNLGRLVSRLLPSLLSLLPSLLLSCLGSGVHFGLGLRQRAAKLPVALDVARQLLGEFRVEFFRRSRVAQRRGERAVLVFAGHGGGNDVHTQRLVIH